MAHDDCVEFGLWTWTDRCTGGRWVFDTSALPTVWSEGVGILTSVKQSFRGRRLRAAMIGATTLLLVGGAGAGIAETTDDGGGFQPITFAQTVGRTAAAPIVGKSVHDLLAQLEARLAIPGLSAATVATAPGTASSAGGQILSMVVDVAGPGASAIRATWGAELLAGALRDAVAANDLPRLDNFQTSERFPDGRTVAVDGGFGNVRRYRSSIRRRLKRSRSVSRRVWRAPV